MRILIYCQYVWGMGHLFRSLELAKAFAPHSVTVAAGGQPVDIELDDHIDLVRLPTLYMDENFTHLISGEPDQDVDTVQQKRLDILQDLLGKGRPDVVIIELFPFGRSAFQFELIPLLTLIREGKFGHIKTVCSLRDILVEKKDPTAYQERVITLLGRYFDLLMVHSDERLMPLSRTFSREGDIEIPVVYSGFITRQPDSRRVAALRKQLLIPEECKLIVASAGGGRSGFRLLEPVLHACRRMRPNSRIQLEVFAGPFMEKLEYEQLEALCQSGINVRRFTDNFLEYLTLADLSISLAGYNTCMNLLVTGVPSLVLPYTRQQEQPLRVDALQSYLPLHTLTSADLAPDRLVAQIETMLEKPRLVAQVPLNLKGADTAADFVVSWAKGK